jgi:hypothetical protein
MNPAEVVSAIITVFGHTYFTVPYAYIKTPEGNGKK